MLWHKAARGHCVPAVGLTNTYLALLKWACWAGCKFGWKLKRRKVWIGDEGVGGWFASEYHFIRDCPGNWVTAWGLNLNVKYRIEGADQVAITDSMNCNHFHLEKQCSDLLFRHVYNTADDRCVAILNWAWSYSSYLRRIGSETAYILNTEKHTLKPGFTVTITGRQQTQIYSRDCYFIIYY